MEFLNEYHLAGLLIGICTFLIIGLFHPIVVKAEYYWGTKCWWIFLVLGIGGIAASLSVDNILVSSLLGVFAFSSFWTIKEVFEQEERVKKGWFPKNPKRTYNLEVPGSSPGWSTKEKAVSRWESAFFFLYPFLIKSVVLAVFIHS